MDYIDLLHLKGEHGKADSLAVLGVQNIHGTNRIQRDYDKARAYFQRALDVNASDIDSNYYMGLLYLYGLGVDVNVERALDYFVKSETDARSLNAIGYIYVSAPDVFDNTDPLKSLQYGSIFKNLKTGEKYFTQAANKGNMNAYYNLGCLHL